MTYTVGDARKDAEALRPKHELWNNDLFQEHFVKPLEQQFAQILEAMLDTPIGEEHVAEKTQVIPLKILGMSQPKTSEESLRLYLSMRAVLRFWKWKLGQLKSESERFKKLEKQLHEAGTANDGTRRSGIVVGGFRNQ